MSSTTRRAAPPSNGQAASPARPARFELDAAHLQRVPAWGRASSSVSWVYRPNSAADVYALFQLARRHGLTVGLRGGGNSYGDAASNSEGLLLDLRRFNRILEWDPVSGVIRLEPGVTLAQLWQYVLEDGWWPPVCTGTMQITLGGGIAMNVHGKNAFKVGPIGDHVLAFDLLLPDGASLTCSREQNSDLFYAAIGGMGLLGCFTSLTLQMKRVYSGLLDIYAVAGRNLRELFAHFERLLPDSDYLVGWVDSVAGGSALGRGQIHQATYLLPGVDPDPQASLRLEHQNLPDTLFGFFPRSLMWRFMQPAMLPWGVRLVNEGKYRASVWQDGHHFRQPHAQFHFLLNYFPDWEKSVGPGGLIQYQPFIPAAHALDAFTELLRLSQARGLAPYLGVLKRHRPDLFLLTHGLDGYSLALDYRLTRANRPAVQALAQAMDEIVLAAGGRFYFAKDSTLRPAAAHTYLGADAMAQFKALKQRCDPDALLQTNLWRRLLAD